MTRPSAALRDHRAEILHALRARGVVSADIFGSIARGTDTDDSDIDIVVRFQPPRFGYDYLGALSDIEEDVEAITGFGADVIGEDDPGVPRVVAERLELLRT